MAAEQAKQLREDPGDTRMTIDQLARLAGTTTRNVRAHQTRGLLPPPRLEGRVGYYEAEHLERLKLIARLQERGFSLAAIAEVLGAWQRGADLREVLGFEEALTAPWSDESPEWISAERLLELFPEGAMNPALLRRAAELEVVVPDGEGFVVRSPRLLRIGRELTESGVPLPEAIEAVARLREQTERIARDFVDLFQRNVWDPFASAGFPTERLHDVTVALQRLRPVAGEATTVLLAQAMEREVSRAASDQIPE
jgi:DNA-binding transcriptional MerR regulator